MGSSLNGQQIKNTYPALLKFSSNGSMPPTTPMIITDGIGNDSPLALSGIEIKTTYIGDDIGLKLNFDTGKFVLGDYANIGRKVSVYVDEPGGSVFMGFNAPNGAGVHFSDFGFGVNPYFVYQSGIFISGGNRISQNYYSGTNDITLEANNTSISLQGVTNSTTITTESLNLSGAGLVNPTPPSSPTPVNYLVVEVNGLPYKIGLFNP